MMKKQRIFMVYPLILSLLLAACSLPQSPAATATSSSEPDVQSTAQGSGSMEITPTTSSDDSSTSVSTAGNCDNPYYPVKEEASWQYNGSNAATGAFSFTRSITAVNADGFSDQDVFSGGTTRTGSWKCDQGALTALNQGALATVSVPSAPGTPTFQAESEESSGVTLPAQLMVGESWDQQLLLQGSMTISEGLSASASNDTQFTCTPVGIESVTVPAGTFDAMKVTCNYEMNINVNMDATGPVNTTFNSTSNIWYAQDVGLIKISDSGDIGSTEIELVGYTIP